MQQESLFCDIFCFFGPADKILDRELSDQSYLSNNNSYESDITVINCDPSQSLVRIKLTSSNLYLTLSDVGIVLTMNITIRNLSEYIHHRLMLYAQ